MARLTQKKLIEQLKQLKEIKPNQDWVVLLKSQILTEEKAKKLVPVPVASTAPENPTEKAGTVDILLSLFFPKRLAYALAVFIFVVTGVFGFAIHTVPGDLLFPIKKLAEQSQAALTGQNKLTKEVAMLSKRVNELAQIAKEGKTNNIPWAIGEVTATASELAEFIKEESSIDKETLEKIVVSSKTLASVVGTDLSENQAITNLYQSLAKQQIADLEKSTLTETQQEALLEIKDLYEKGNYIEALEKILLITNNQK